MSLPELEKCNQCLEERSREETCEFAILCCLHRRVDEQMDRESAAEFLLTLWNLCLLFSLCTVTLGSNQDYILMLF